MPLLEDCPYFVQVLFWTVMLGGAGWVIGIAQKQIRITVERHRESTSDHWG